MSKRHLSAWRRRTSRTDTVPRLILIPGIILIAHSEKPAARLFVRDADQEDDSHTNLDTVVLKRGRETLGAFSHDECWFGYS